MEESLMNAAEYMLMLGTNEVTDEVRAAYFTGITTHDEFLEAFGLILESVLKGIENEIIDRDTGYNLIKNEYTVSEMTTHLGDFSIFDNLVNQLIEAMVCSPGSKQIEDFMAFADIAKTLDDERIRISIYQAVLLRLVQSAQALNNIEFTKEIMKYVKESTVDNQDRKLYRVIRKATNRM